MKNNTHIYLAVIVAFYLLTSLSAAQENDEPLVLRYNKPAVDYSEAIPIGNGRLGAVIFGEPKRDRIGLSEDTFWSGSPYNPANSNASNYLERARDLVLQSQYEQAQQLIDRQMMGQPSQQASFQPIGDVILEFGEIDEHADYKRELDIGKAIAEVSYKSGQIEYKRQYFSSLEDNVIIVKLSSSKPASLNFAAYFQAAQENFGIEVLGDDSISMRVRSSGFQGVSGLVEADSILKVLTQGGETAVADGRIIVDRADSALILISCATNFVDFNNISADSFNLASRYLSQALRKSFDELKASHIRRYQTLFERLSMDFGSPAVSSSTDKRITNFADSLDLQLLSLYFQFGRYLLISSSMPGTEPAHLQGIWSDAASSSKQSRYSLDVNTQMSYWLAEPANLAECHQPLFKLIEQISQTGEDTASAHYDAEEGWVCHHNTDIWRASAPAKNAKEGFWKCGGAWLALHLWYHYQYGADEQFLNYAYPIMKGAADFFLDSLYHDINYDRLVTVPTLSPRNEHQPGITICSAATIDAQIIRDLFESLISASQILDTDLEFRRILEDRITYLAPNEIGILGQLQEWFEDIDHEAPDLNHHRLSHLYGVFPSSQINPADTPELAEAAIESLELRGEGGTALSKAWKANIWTKLGDGDKAYKMLASLISNKTNPNMLALDYNFQIDATLGAVSAICNMFVQSKAYYDGENLIGEITLLPALPSNLPNGSIKGIRAKGGFTVDLEWQNSILVEAVITSKKGNILTVKYRDRMVSDTTFSDYTYRFDRSLVRY